MNDAFNCHEPVAHCRKSLFEQHVRRRGIEMAVAIENHPELNLTIFKATGSVPFSEQMQVLISFYKESPTRNVIWDFTRATDVTISNSELRSIIQYTKRHAAKRQAGRTALVADTNLKYGLGRMASTFAEIEDTPWDMQVFEHLDEALAWIAETDPKGNIERR